MSGTSVDAIDAALVRFSDNDVELLHTHQHAIPPQTRQQISAISHSGDDEIERLGVLDRELGLLFGAATRQLLASAGQESRAVTAIGSHGQTIRHRPPSGAAGSAQSFTLQIGDPNTIAECTGIATVADFRRRDIAAGGEGAPLAPAFHAAAFGKAGVNRAIVNIGGIANVSFLEGPDLRQGFDSGPGNTLLDHWILRHHGETFDRDGRWSASGQCHQGLLAKLLAHPYFAKAGPRSTGKEAFNLQWLETQLGSGEMEIAAKDIQATLVELTCTSISQAIQNSPIDIEEVYICGGGAHNLQIMSRLGDQLSPRVLASTSRVGMDPDWVEAVTFAWLAKQCLNGLAGNEPAVTGAIGARVLGGIYPGQGQGQALP